MSTVSSSTTSTTSSTTAYYSSSGSGIDWDALVEAAVTARTAAADTIDTKISDNEAKIEAYQEMQSLLQDVTDAAEALRAPSESSAKSDDVFLSRAAYLTANGDVDESAALSVTVEDGSDLGSYDIQIIQVAKAHKVTSDTVAANTDELGYDGVFTLGLGTGDTANITIDADMTLDEIAEAINNVSDTTNVKASVVKIADGEYQLLLSGAETGQDIVATAVSGDDVLTSLGITDASGDFADVLQASQDAIVSVDGLEITRDSNEIDDILEGVTLHLYAVTPDDTSITVEVGTDLSTVKEAVQTLVDAYNAYRAFAYTQQQVTSSGTAADDALLFGDGTLRSTNSRISEALSTMIDSLAITNIGLSFDESNNLVLDEDTLDDALLDNLEGIQALFAFQATVSSSDLMVLSRGSSAATSFTLDVVTDDDGNITSASVGGDSSLFTVSGTRIVGAEGTQFEGFSFVYVGEDSQSIDVDISYGVAELLYNAADSIGNDTDGTLTTIIDGMEDEDTRLQTRSDDIRDRAEVLRDSLTARYAAYESKIAEAKSTLAYLQALLDAESSSS